MTNKNDEGKKLPTPGKWAAAVAASLALAGGTALNAARSREASTKEALTGPMANLVTDSPLGVARGLEYKETWNDDSVSSNGLSWASVASTASSAKKFSVPGLPKIFDSFITILKSSPSNRLTVVKINDNAQSQVINYTPEQTKIVLSSNFARDEILNIRRQPTGSPTTDTTLLIADNPDEPLTIKFSGATPGLEIFKDKVMVMHQQVTFDCTAINAAEANKWFGPRSAVFYIPFFEPEITNKPREITLLFTRDQLKGMSLGEICDVIDPMITPTIPNFDKKYLIPGFSPPNDPKSLRLTADGISSLDFGDIAIDNVQHDRYSPKKRLERIGTRIVEWAKENQQALGISDEVITEFEKSYRERAATLGDMPAMLPPNGRNRGR